jgi:hypothetical protein
MMTVDFLLPGFARSQVDWMRRAACRDKDPSLFDTDCEVGNADARKVCKSCEVLNECFAWAMDREPTGIWAGLSERERTSLRRKRKGASMHDTVVSGILAAARETYQLEESLGGVDGDALAKALQSALVVHERHVIEKMAGVLEALAYQLDEEEGCEEAIGLLAGVEKLLREIPPLAAENQSYRPRQDDIVEVVLAGRVHIAQEFCDMCGHASNALWSVYDYATGAEYFFDEAEVRGNLHVRVLQRADR